MDPGKWVIWAGLLTVILSTMGSSGAHAATTGPPRLAPAKEGQEVLLFEAGHHDVSMIQNYTARWKAGSQLVPVAKAVTDDDGPWIEFAFRGTNGMACSTFFFEKMPDPDLDRSYAGLSLTIHCDRDDYPHIGVNAVFSDNSQIAHDLALDRGTHRYVVETGFRREKRPPDWSLLSHVMITLDTARESPGISYRLKRMALRQIAGSPGQDAGSMVDKYSEWLLSPRPKEVTWQDGAFPARRGWPLILGASCSERTRRTAEIFAERYHGHTGRRPEIGSPDGSAPGGGGIALRLRPTNAGQRPQGYELKVAPGGVTIEGNDEPGLYYGTVTFFQLLKHALKRGEPELPIRCVKISDWPDLTNRLIRLEHPHTFRNYPVRENRGIDYLIDWTDRFVAGHKFNTFYIDVSANVRYERRPEFNGSEKIYSLAELRRLGDFCRDHFIDVCPAWQIGGHANWWLTIGYHPELREKGWPSQADVTHPDHDAIVRDCMLDVIEALRPKYASPKSDEWWHERKEGEAPDPLLRGKTRAQAYLGANAGLNAWLKERGITMMMFEDMLSPYHNGKRFDTYRTIDAFPKDIIMTLWSGGNVDREIRYFSDRGFRVWPNATGMFVLSEEARRRVIGFGKGMYSFGDDKTGLLDANSPLWSLSNLIRVGDYAWNINLGEDRDADRMVAIQHLSAIRENTRAVGRPDPIDLGRVLKDRFDEFLAGVGKAPLGPGSPLAGGAREVGFVPMRLGGAGGKDCAVVRKGSAPVELPVKGKFSSLVFLHTAFVNDPKDKNVAGVRVRDWMYGWPCGNYIVEYEGGARRPLPVRLTNNIKRLDTAPATRATLDCRYTWGLRDSPEDPVHFFQWEWVNPEPDRDIERVIMEHDNILDVSLVLFAISGTRVVQ